jgi:hypothetical protein
VLIREVVMKGDTLLCCRCAATRLVYRALHSHEAMMVRAIASVAVMGIRSFLN